MDHDRLKAFMAAKGKAKAEAVEAGLSGDEAHAHAELAAFDHLTKKQPAPVPEDEEKTHKPAPHHDDDDKGKKKGK